VVNFRSMTAKIHNRKSIKNLRQALRHSPTEAEARLWSKLRRSQLAGKKFRRQHSIGNYVLDFYCPEVRLAVELDGSVHSHPVATERDIARTRFLEELNVRVLRFENRLVFENLEGVMESIKSHLM
jgi:very-short-patch-repair endonuclease